MFDGDKLLVCNHPILINAAERVNAANDVVPLFYDMKKANAEEITPENLYKGLSLAFTGGNIGAPSNDITKIWNSGEITEESFKAVKWLVATVNYVIDYAKTLYKPNTPKYAEDIIQSYTKSKVPYFFVYAKDKELKQVEHKNQSVVNRIREMYPPRKLCFNFSQDNLGKLDYRVLLSNPLAVADGEVYDAYKELAGSLEFASNADKLSEDDQSLNNYLAVFEDCKQAFFDWGRQRGLSEQELIDSLIVSLFAKPNDKKKAFWTMFGEYVYDNINKNISDSFRQCYRCRNRFLSVDDKLVCEKCQRYLDKRNLKLSRCSECGEVLYTPLKNRVPSKCACCTNAQSKQSKLIYKVVNGDSN